MSQQWSNKAKEVGLAALSGVATQVGLFNGHPSLGGSAEVTGGGYARQTLSWGTTPTDGTAFDAGQYTFSVAPSAVFTHGVTFNAAGQWLTATSLGTITMDSATGNKVFALLTSKIEIADEA